MNISIIGATGYVGQELVRLLLKHPKVRITHLGSTSTTERYDKLFPAFAGFTDLKLEPSDLKAFAEDSDCVFLSLPHGIASKEVTKEILAKTKIIDMGADFRLKDVKTYEAWYGVKHYSPGLLDKAVYGLSELYRDDIKKARLIANPGCYTTASILALAPLMQDGRFDTKNMVIDAASGVTGAGRKATTANLFCEVDEDFKAYGITSHRHTPEIEQELGLLAKSSVILNFTPHLVPMQRGILTTCYVPSEEVSTEELKELYDRFYENEYFIRCLEDFPQTKFVKGSNFVDIGFTYDKRTGRTIVLSAIDNLIKGAAGQAIQNMNLMFGFDEKTGIDMIPETLI